MSGHAWIEVGGCVVGDDPDIATRFSPLSREAVLSLVSATGATWQYDDSSHRSA
jgi:hypothetical protein